MNILILGGSGILSSDFTKYCLDSGNEVYIVNRGKRKAFIDNRAKLIIADLRDENIDTLKKKFRDLNYDVVVDFLSYIPEHVKKTIAIVREQCKQYVFISSATAYVKSTPNEIITENNQLGNREWEYAFQKSLCEKFLSKQDIVYTIIRPYVTFGVSRIPFPIIPDGFHYSLIQRIKENKPVLMLDGGEAICTLTCTKDFAVVLYRLLLNKNAFREAFHITSSNRQSWKKVYQVLCKILNEKQNILSISIEEVHKYLPEFEFILKGDKGQNMLFDNTKVLDAIGGYNFEYTLEKALKESVDYFESHPEMQKIDYKWDGKCDYVASKKGIKGLNAVSSNIMPNNKKWYKIMTNPISWNLYALARKSKHMVNKYIFRI